MEKSSVNFTAFFDGISAVWNEGERIEVVVVYFEYVDEDMETVCGSIEVVAEFTEILAVSNEVVACMP